jgi:hypothetical protein
MIVLKPSSSISIYVTQNASRAEQELALKANNDIREALKSKTEDNSF